MSTDAYSNLDIGRNEPCPCGSGKKYKRCHGVAAAPKLSTPATLAPPVDAGTSGAAAGPGMGGAFGGFDPSSLDPAMMMQMTQAIQRLPKSQLQRLQAIMQKAMAGRDVTREAQELERSLPVEFQEMMRGFAATLPADLGGVAGAGGEAPAIDIGALTGAAVPTTGAAADAGGLTEEQAREIVAKAAAEGKISTEQAAELLGGEAAGSESGKSSFWDKLRGGKG